MHGRTPWSSNLKFLILFYHEITSTVQGCHGQGKVRENQNFFKVREKSGNFAKSQGKSQFFSKSVKSQGILFSGFVKFMKTFSFG